MKSLNYWHCSKCGANFREPNYYTVDEDRGEFWGIPCRERMRYDVCPKCKSEDIDEKYADEDTDNFDDIVSEVEDSEGGMDIGYNYGHYSY